jgi:hypothetical protein
MAKGKLGGTTGNKGLIWGAWLLSTCGFGILLGGVAAMQNVGGSPGDWGWCVWGWGWGGGEGGRGGHRHAPRQELSGSASPVPAVQWSNHPDQSLTLAKPSTCRRCLQDCGGSTINMLTQGGGGTVGWVERPGALASAVATLCCQRGAGTGPRRPCAAPISKLPTPVVCGPPPPPPPVVPATPVTTNTAMTPCLHMCLPFAPLRSYLAPVSCDHFFQYTCAPLCARPLSLCERARWQGRVAHPPCTWPSPPRGLPHAGWITFLHFFTWLLVLVYLLLGVIHKARWPRLR